MQASLWPSLENFLSLILPDWAWAKTLCAVVTDCYTVNLPHSQVARKQVVWAGPLQCLSINVSSQCSSHKSFYEKFKFDKTTLKSGLSLSHLLSMNTLFHHRSLAFFMHLVFQLWLRPHFVCLDWRKSEFKSLFLSDCWHWGLILKQHCPNQAPWFHWFVGHFCLGDSCEFCQANAKILPWNYGQILIAKPCSP